MKDETLDKGWEEKFDEKFVDTCKIWNCATDEPNPTVENEFKQFITNLLAERTAEIIERVKPVLRKKFEELYDNQYSLQAWNEADEIINLIKE